MGMMKRSLRPSILYLVPAIVLALMAAIQLPMERSLGGSSPLLNTNNGNKTLVIVMGNVRGGEVPFQSLQTNLLDPNQADLALLIGTTRKELQDSSLFARAKYIWPVPEFEDWADAFDLIEGKTWRKTLLPLVPDGGWVFGGIKGHEYVGSGSIGLMMRWFLLEQLKQDARVLEQYDRFVLTRSDHCYVCQHQNLSSLDQRVLWVPKGEDYGGITDRHLVVSRENILKALNVLPPILRNPQKYKHLFATNFEHLLAQRWEEEGLLVRRMERVMFVCGENGDKTRTTQLRMQTPELGVMLKYPKEYVASFMTCGKQPGLVG